MARQGKQGRASSPQKTEPSSLLMNIEFPCIISAGELQTAIANNWQSLV
jgi:hypothetical protein